MLCMKFCVNFISSTTNFFAFLEDMFVDPHFRFYWVKNIFRNFMLHFNKFRPEIGKLEYQKISP